MRMLACVHRMCVEMCVYKIETNTQSCRHRKSQWVNMSCVWCQPYARYNSAWSLQVTDITHTHTRWSVGHFEIKAFITSDCPFIRRNRKWPRYQWNSVSQLLDTAFPSLWTWIHWFLWLSEVMMSVLKKLVRRKKQQRSVNLLGTEIVAGCTWTDINVCTVSDGNRNRNLQGLGPEMTLKVTVNL